MTHMGRRKALFYGLVLFAAVVGVVIDRTRFSPASARGERALPGSPVQPANTAEEFDPSTIGPPIALLFSHPAASPALDTSSTAPSAGPAVRDIFVASPAIQEYYRGHRAGAGGGNTAAEANTEDSEGKTLAVFAQAHQLQATCAQGKRSWALIDNKVLRLGDNLDGFVLRQIDHYRVVFTHGEGKVDLPLPVPFTAKVPATEPR